MITGKLGVIKVCEIDFGKRGRQDYKDVSSLASSIKERGLIHPIAVTPHPLGNGFLLLAGGRRLRAHQLLGEENIECKVFPPGLSELEVKTIELSENIHREDLEYHERIAMEKEVRDLMVQIHGRKISTAQDAPGVSDRDVACMLGISHAKLVQDLGLAATMETFSDIDWTKCKNRSEALKLKDNIGKVFVRQEAAKRFEETIGSTAKDNIKRKMANCYVVGDFFENVVKIPDNSINLVEIDPPYAIDLQGMKKKTGYGNYSYGETGYNEVEKSDYTDFMLRTLKECYRVMAQDSFLILWFSPDPWFQPCLDWLRASKFSVRGLPCVWAKGEEDNEGVVKLTTGQTHSPMRHLASSCEFFFYAKKGDPRIIRQGRTNHFGYKPVPPTRKIHPTERPLDLMTDVLTTFSMEGSRVLVPFAGSGNTLIAAFNNKMTPIGFDLGSTHKEAYMVRLEEML